MTWQSREIFVKLRLSQGQGRADGATKWLTTSVEKLDVVQLCQTLMVRLSHERLTRVYD